MRSPSPGWERALLRWFDPREPFTYRGPFLRWPHISDGVLAVVVFALSLVAVTVSALDDGEDYSINVIGDIPAGAVTLLAAAAVALLVRRRSPIGAATVVMAMMLTWAIAGYGDGQDLALFVALYAVGRYVPEPRRAIAILIAAVAVSTVGTIIDASQRVDVAPAILLIALPWYVGIRMRNRGEYFTLLQERAERLEADQEAQARKAVADERSRIARELHDVVAHQVSMMTVQAGAAKTIAVEDPEAAILAMADVEHAGREALGDLRHLLGVLRADTSDPDHLGPQPGLADIPDLVGHLTQTGADVTSSLGEVSGDLAASVDLSAFRIVQESFTNIIKHAGPNPTVEITTSLDGSRLSIEITNSTGSTENADSAAPGPAPSGYGIAGMRERVALLGGDFAVGPQPPDRFQVRARLPIKPEKT